MASKVGTTIARIPMCWLHKYPAWFYAVSFILCLEITEMFASLTGIAIAMLRTLMRLLFG